MLTLNLPAEAETKTVLDFGRVTKTREAGELLHPEREGLVEIARVKTELGSYAYAAQYQQKPAPAGGGVFQLSWFKRYGERQAQYEQIVQSWDTAAKAKEANDPTVCTTWGVKPNGYDLLDVFVKRMEFPEIKRAIVNNAEKWHPDAILIEDKSTGESLIPLLKDETALTIIAIQPDADKITRARAQSAQVESGLVSLPEQASWLLDYEQELSLFPNSSHFDQVDSTTQFLRWIKSKQKQSEPKIRRL